jgi:hypothetical protein
VKLPAVVATPPGVVTEIVPLVAPAGTVAVIWVAEFTVKVVAFVPWKLTIVAPVRFVPGIEIDAPTAPEFGEGVPTVGMPAIFAVTAEVWVLAVYPCFEAVSLRRRKLPTSAVAITYESDVDPLPLAGVHGPDVLEETSHCHTRLGVTSHDACVAVNVCPATGDPV